MGAVKVSHPHVTLVISYCYMSVESPEQVRAVTLLGWTDYSIVLGRELFQNPRWMFEVRNVLRAGSADGINTM